MGADGPDRGRVLSAPADPPDAAAALASLLVALRAAASPTDRAAAISAVLKDRGLVAALARYSVDEADAYDAAMMDLGGVPGAGARVTQLGAAIRRAADALPPPPKSQGPQVEQDEGPQELTDDALLALDVPPGWTLNGSGVWYERTVDGEPVLRQATATPCAVVEILESLRDSTERSRLRWRRGSGAWCEAVYPRGMLGDTRKVLDLRAVGIDVTSLNSRPFVGWLAAAENHNAAKVPRSAISDRMGWQGPKGRGTTLGFLAGEEHVSAAGGPRCVLDVADEGRAQVAAAMRPSGTLDGWRAAIAAVREYPSVMLALYASLACPFLGVVEEAPSGIVDWSGLTSKGKSSAMAAAASPWGHPKKGQHFVSSWDSTPSFIEGAADLLRHLPLCLDDTRDCKDPAIIERLIYTYAGESGRGRARPDGLRASLESRGLLLSNGEQAITSFGSGGGARARSLCLRGWPLGDDGHWKAVDLMASLSEHHGVAGPAVVRWLVDRRALWPSVRTAWRDSRAEYANATKSNVGQRLSALLALLGAGAFAAHEILGIPPYSPADSPLLFAVTAADQQADEADRPAAAVGATFGWACAHASEFWGREVRDRSTGEARQPSAGWAGSWKAGAWSEIAWVPGCLERVLRFEGFRPEEVISGWVERGWLQVDGKNRGRKRGIGERGDSPRCYVIPRKVYEQIIGDVESDAPGDDGPPAPGEDPGGA